MNGISASPVVVTPTPATSTPLAVTAQQCVDEIKQCLDAIVRGQDSQQLVLKEMLIYGLQRANNNKVSVREFGLMWRGHEVILELDGTDNIIRFFAHGSVQDKLSASIDLLYGNLKSEDCLDGCSTTRCASGTLGGSTLAVPGTACLVVGTTIKSALLLSCGVSAVLFAPVAAAIAINQFGQDPKCTI